MWEAVLHYVTLYTVHCTLYTVHITLHRFYCRYADGWASMWESVLHHEAGEAGQRARRTEQGQGTV